MSDKLEEIRIKLESYGFTGLVVPGECGCEISDLAPCGQCEQEDGEEFINGCEGGYKHLDPRTGHKEYEDFCISTNKEAPTLEEWEEMPYD